MSVRYTCGDLEIWVPSAGLGFLFYEQLVALERTYSRENQRCGITPRGTDTFAVDPKQLERFLQPVLAWLERTNHRPGAALEVGCCELALVLLFRCRRSWPAVPSKLQHLLEQARQVNDTLDRDAALPVPPFGQDDVPRH